MAAMIAKRPPAAVKELEVLQQQERTGAGEPELTTEQFRRLLRESIQQELISDQLRSGGEHAAVDVAGDDARVEEIYQERLKIWRVDDPSQWSRYEMPAARWAIADACARIESVFAQHNRSLKDVPVVGTLTTGQTTACTQGSSVGTPIVLIDNGFFRFSGIMSQLAVFASYDATFRGEFSEATLQLLSDLVATQIVLNTCLYAYIRLTPPDFRTTVADLQDAISLFVISHEYAHVSAGDLNAHPVTPQQPDETLRTKEFEADKIGFQTVVETAKQSGAGVLAPFVFLAGQDMLDRARAAYKGRSAQPESRSLCDYPTPYERTVSLLDWLETTSYKDRFGAQIREASACYNTILFVWDRILRPFWAAREPLAKFDPAVHGPSRYPEADALGVASTLWGYVKP